MKLIATQRETDHYKSKYFDYQISNRYLFQLPDGNNIETGVYEHYEKEIPQGLAIDISMMIGCPMKCKFCASGSIDYIRVLTPDEMLNQIIEVLKNHDIEQFPKLTCAFQGIGEPSLVSDQIIETINIVKEYNDRFVFSISTIGSNLNAIKSWRVNKIQIDNLQFSLHGTNNKQIRTLIPNSPPINKLLSEIDLCSNTKSIDRTRCNYILIQDYNDADEDIERLVKFFQDKTVSIRLASLNPTNESLKFNLKSCDSSRAIKIRDQLLNNGIESFLFGSFNPTNASCGQLTFTNKDCNS